MQSSNPNKQEINMFKSFPFLKKFSLTILVLAIGLIAMPASITSATGLQDETTPPARNAANREIPNPTRDNERLEQIWDRAQTAYQLQGNRLANADSFINRVQSLIDRANRNNLDTFSLQAALNTFAAVIPAARIAHTPGTAILASHTGFDTIGKVSHRAAAIETIKALHQVLKDTRAALNGTGQVLGEAVKTFRDSHRPTPTTITP
jgi:hypothetical protein